jgi:hypothetical protein
MTNVEDVCKWLQSFKVNEQSIKNFRDNEIDYQALKSLSKDELKNE